MSDSYDAKSNDAPTEVVYKDRQPVLVVRAATLRVVAGPDAGKACALETQRVRVGSGSDNDLPLSDTLVSRRHLELSVADHGYLLRDLGSTNGTFFRGARVREALLAPGAELRLGETVLRIERREERSSSIAPQRAFGSLVGTSRAMQEVFGLLSAVAPTDTTVLVLGETGTGKELVAAELHENSPRRARPFLVLDCGAIPRELIESELFGHVRGAFTGADSDRAGIFEQANGGTIFLDEIGELPQELQTRLLRVLDQRTVRRVGEHTPRAVDIRVVAATHRDLRDAVRAGTFRQDLFYRLSVVQIRLPPLRERPEDVPILARHFIREAGGRNPEDVLGPEVLEVLTTRRWPGNVRELRNVVERAMVLADGAVSAFEESTARRIDGAAPPPLPADVQAGAAPGAGASPDDDDEQLRMPTGVLDKPYKEAKDMVVRQFEVLYLTHLMERHGYNISRMAADAEVDRHLIRKLLRKHDMLAR
ncbi:MAG: sigma 54-interacting transcriptional regulator [Myxococcales bacterium]|nr:sigma 54-interacting transcriptional regulator [Myxococcales bacterium]